MDSGLDVHSSASSGSSAADDRQSTSPSSSPSAADAWSSFSAVSVDPRPSPWSTSPPAGRRRKHLSLPANLPSLLRNSDVRSAEYRRRHPSTGVRFADEVRDRTIYGRRMGVELLRVDCCYLLQGGYVFIGVSLFVCLFVCSLTGVRKNYSNDFHKIR